MIRWICIGLLTILNPLSAPQRLHIVERSTPQQRPSIHRKRARLSLPQRPIASGLCHSGASSLLLRLFWGFNFQYSISLVFSFCSGKKTHERSSAVSGSTSKIRGDDGSSGSFAIYIHFSLKLKSLNCLVARCFFIR